MKATEHPLTDLTGKLPEGCHDPVCHERSECGEYILARWDTFDGTEQWVTWFIGRNGQPCAGHYFRKQDPELEPFGSALVDFRRRLRGEA